MCRGTLLDEIDVKNAVVYMAIGCANGYWHTHTDKYIYQQYPQWMRKLPYKKVLILVDPVLESTPVVVEDTQTSEKYKHLKCNRGYDCDYYYKDDIHILAFRTAEIFKVKYYGTDGVLEDHTIAIYKSLIEKVLESGGIFINAFYSGHMESLLANMFPDVPKDRVIFNLGYGVDYSCYPPLNATTTPLIYDVGGQPRIKNPYSVGKDELFRVWSDKSEDPIFREQLAIRLVSFVDYVRKYAAFVDFIHNLENRGETLTDQWYLCNLVGMERTQFQHNYECPESREYAIQYAETIYTRDYLEIFRLIPALDQCLIDFSQGSRYVNVSRIYQAVLKILGVNPPTS